MCGLIQGDQDALVLGKLQSGHRAEVLAHPPRVVERHLQDLADDRQDGEVVRHGHDGCVGMLLGKLHDGAPRTLLDLRQRLAAGHLRRAGVLGPAPGELRVPPQHLLASEPFQLTGVGLPKPSEWRNRHLKGLRYDLRGFEGPSHGAAVQLEGQLLGQCLCKGLGLGLAGRVQWVVVSPLDAAVLVQMCLAVPDQYQSHPELRFLQVGAW